MSDAPTPSQQIVNAAQAVHRVVDERGRAIRYRTLTVLDFMRSVQAVSAADAQKPTYMQFVQVAFSILDIDGVPCLRPTTSAGIEGIIERLGDDGFLAVATHVSGADAAPAGDAAPPAA